MEPDACNRRLRRLPLLASQATLSYFTLRLTVLPAVYCGVQQMAEPSSSAHFVRYAAAFYTVAYGSACSFAAARNRHQRCPPPPALRATLSHFTLRLKPRKMRGTYTEIARLQPDCNFSVKSRKMSRTHTGISGGFTALKFFSCQGRRERLQQAAKPPSSACFAGYAVAFYIAAKAA